MKRSLRIWLSVAVAGVVLFCGSALIQLGSRYQALLEQTETEQTARTASRSLGQELRTLLRTVQDTGQAPALPQIAPDLKVPDGEETSALEGIVIGHYDKLVDTQGRELSEAEFENLRTDVNQLAASNWPSVIGPYRSADGDWLLAIVVAYSFDTESESPRPVRWFGGLIDVDHVLQSSQFGQLVTTGFDYELFTLDPTTGKKRIISRNTERQLDSSLTETIDLTNDRWKIAVSRRDTLDLWRTNGEKIILVGALTLLCALAAYDFLGRLGRVEGKLQKSSERLREANQRLLAETHYRIEARKEFTHASFHDPVSGLPNRHYFFSRLERSLLNLRRQGNSFLAVLIVSLDRLRNVSEGLGHTAADELLNQALRRITESLQPSDVEIARLANDELAVLLSDLSTSEAAISAAERLRETLTQAFQIDNQTVFVTPTIGLTVRSSGFEKAEELVREADIALARARTQGRDRVAVFNREASEELAMLRQLEMGLHEAAARREFTLHFQPIVSLATGRIAGMESLIRWQHPILGLVGPDKFIRMAEELDIIGSITRWVITEACAQLRDWRETIPQGNNFYLSVNLSGQDMIQPDLCDFIVEVLQENRLRSDQLRIEVTEGAMIENFKVASDMAQRLRDMGISLLLDDFGTGYSSLSYLHRLHVDYLKIDRSFIRSLTADAEENRIVRSIIHLAEGLRMSTIAEGVDTLGKLIQLRELGCHYGQGFYFSKPMDAESVAEMLSSARAWHVGQTPRVAGQRYN